MVFEDSRCIVLLTKYGEVSWISSYCLYTDRSEYELYLQFHMMCVFVYPDCVTALCGELLRA
jgi:hypothetical protein